MRFNHVVAVAAFGAIALAACGSSATDVNGEGTGGFFAVGIDGKLIKSAPSTAMAGY
jgi:hypothetical protein